MQTVTHEDLIRILKETLDKYNVIHKRVLTIEKEDADFFISLVWDNSNNLYLIYNSLVLNLEKGFVEELIEEEVKHYVECLSWRRGAKERPW